MTLREMAHQIARDESAKAAERHGPFPREVDLVLAGMREALERAWDEIGTSTPHRALQRLFVELNELKPPTTSSRRSPLGEEVK